MDTTAVNEAIKLCLSEIYSRLYEAGRLQDAASLMNRILQD